MATYQDDSNIETLGVEALLEDIRSIAQEQTELSLSIAEGLLSGAKSLVERTGFDSLEEANAFLRENRAEMMNYAGKLHELIASCYLDDLIGQKVMKVQKALMPAVVSSKIADSIIGDSDVKKIEIANLELSHRLLQTPFRQSPLM